MTKKLLELLVIIKQKVSANSEARKDPELQEALKEFERRLKQYRSKLKAIVKP